MKLTDHLYVSERGEILALDEDPIVPIITVELYCKWYSLHVIHINGNVSTVPFTALEHVYKEGSAFRDHVPNPDAVRAYSEHMNYSIEPLAEELIEGRWKLESNG